jgi:hypothetical protein
VQLTDGDGTVPLLSLGALCEGGWRRRKLNPGGSRVVVREYPHEPVYTLKDPRWVLSCGLCGSGGPQPGRSLEGCGWVGGVQEYPHEPVYTLKDPRCAAAGGAAGTASQAALPAVRPAPLEGPGPAHRTRAAPSNPLHASSHQPTHQRRPQRIDARGDPGRRRRPRRLPSHPGPSPPLPLPPATPPPNRSGGPGASTHVEILGNDGVLDDILRIVSGADASGPPSEAVPDRRLSKISEIAGNIDWGDEE